MVFAISVIGQTALYDSYDSSASVLINRISPLSDLDKIPLIKELVEHYINNNPNKAPEWISKGLTICQKLSIKSDEADFYIYSGKVDMIQSNYLKSLEKYQKALNLKLELDDKQGIASALNEMAYSYNYLGEYQKGLSFSYEAEKTALEINDKKNLVDAFNNIAIAKYILKDSSDIHKLTDKAIELAKESNHIIGLASAYVHKSIFYISRRDLKKALEYSLLSMEEYKKVNYLRGIGGNLENIAIIYKFLKKTDMALNYHNQALKVKRHIGDIQGIASSLANVGIIYWDLKDYNSALQYISSSYNIRKDIRDLRGLTAVTSYLSEINEELGNNKDALRYHKELKAYSDTLFNETKQKQINELSAQFESEQKEKEILDLQKDNNYNYSLNKYLLIIIALILVVTILLILLIIRDKRLNKILSDNNKQILEQKNQLEILNTELTIANNEKDKLFAVIAHDLRSPFQSILGFGSLIANSHHELTKEEIVTYFNLIYQSHNNVYDLLENLLQWSLIKMNKLKISPSSFEIKPEIEKIRDIYLTTIKEKKLFIDIKLNDDFKVFGDKNSLGIVFRNVISNALKFTEDNGEIIISGSLLNNKTLISVKDSGVGISQEMINELFSPNAKTTRGTAGEKGTGFGLVICKEIVEMNNGSISAKSEVGKGTEFIITLPTEM